MFHIGEDMNQIRREKINQYIQENGAVSIKEISALFPEVSMMTIHRDLDKLEEQGSIIRTRGGAMPGSRQVSAAEAKLESRMHTNVEAKKLMGKKAASLISKGSAVFFDAGTSTLSLARELPDMDLNIFTTGPNIALELSRLNNPTIHICGGTLNKANHALSGPSTLQMLENINIATAFIGVSGYTDESGFTCGKEEEMMVKMLVMEKAVKKVILMDCSKCGRILPYTFGVIEDADYIIGDDKLPADFVKKVEEAGTILL